MLAADITGKVIIKFCTSRKMDKMYMLILVTTDLKSLVVIVQTTSSSDAHYNLLLQCCS